MHGAHPRGSDASLLARHSTSAPVSALNASRADWPLLTEGGAEIKSSVNTTDRTGVEMEALVAASVAALTLYDMAKSLDKRITIEQVRLTSKTGGKSGDFHADE